MSRSGTSDSRYPGEDVLKWTPRQREVLDLLARSKSNAAIAEALGISLEGAKYHVREIMSKLDVESREEAAEYWRRRNDMRARIRRSWQGIAGLAPAKWLAAGSATAAVIGVGGIALILMLAGNSDGHRPTAADDEVVAERTAAGAPPGDETPSAAISESPTAMPTPAPAATSIPTPDDESDFEAFLVYLDAVVRSGDLSQLIDRLLPETLACTADQMPGFNECEEVGEEILGVNWGSDMQGVFRKLENVASHLAARAEEFDADRTDEYGAGELRLHATMETEDGRKLTVLTGILPPEHWDGENPKRTTVTLVWEMHEGRWRIVAGGGSTLEGWMPLEPDAMFADESWQRYPR